MGKRNFIAPDNVPPARTEQGAAILARLEKATADLTLTAVGQSLECFGARLHVLFASKAFHVKIETKTVVCESENKDLGAAMLACVRKFIGVSA